MVDTQLAHTEEALREYGLGLPGAWEDFPWGHCALKVRKKVFAFLALEDGMVSLSAKLPLSSGVAEHLPFASPTGYGLGASGWVTARFVAGDEIPLELMQSWVLESYRAIAPPALVKQLPEGTASGAAMEIVGFRRVGS